MQVTLLSSSRQLEDMLRALGIEVTRAKDDPATFKPGDVVVVDVRGGTGLPPVVPAIKRHHHDTSVVIVASTLDPALLLDAMRAGVNEVVAEPLVQEELGLVIERVAGARVHAEPGRVYAFVGAKGGVGTTTIAVNTATALGALSKPARTLLVDFQRAGGDAALFTGAEPRFSIADALENTHRLDHVFFRNLVVQMAPGTDLLASPERASDTFDRAAIQQVINFAASVYKHTVIDVPRSDASILEALDRVTTIYIVANHELATVKSANRTATLLRQRYGRDKVSVVVSRSDREADISHNDIEKAVGCAVAHIFPSNYRVALQALNKGRPLALDNHNDLSASFKRFAQQLAGQRVTREASRPSGLFGRLTHSRS